MPLIHTVYETPASTPQRDAVHGPEANIFQNCNRHWTSLLMISETVLCNSLGAWAASPSNLRDIYRFSYSAPSQNRAHVFLSEEIPWSIQYINQWLLLEMGDHIPVLVVVSFAHSWQSPSDKQCIELSLRSIFRNSTCNSGAFSSFSLDASITFHVHIRIYRVDQSGLLFDCWIYGSVLNLSEERYLIVHAFIIFDTPRWKLCKSSNVNSKH